MVVKLWVENVRCSINDGEETIPGTLPDILVHPSSTSDV